MTQMHQISLNDLITNTCQALANEYEIIPPSSEFISPTLVWPDTSVAVSKVFRPHHTDPNKEYLEGFKFQFMIRGNYLVGVDLNLERFSKEGGAYLNAMQDELRRCVSEQREKDAPIIRVAADSTVVGPPKLVQ